MSNPPRFLVALLVAANVVAFGIGLGMSRLAADTPGVDACEEYGPGVTGCGCICEDLSFIPKGCYEGAHDGYDCTNWYTCDCEPE